MLNFYYNILSNPTTILTLSYLDTCCSFFLSLHRISVCLFSLMTPFLLVSHSVLSSLLAVSRKQMRTLRCRLRYTGLASWPCSVHPTATTTRCTEPLKHQPSVTLCRLSTLACLLLLLLTRSLPHHTPD